MSGIERAVRFLSSPLKSIEDRTQDDLPQDYQGQEVKSSILLESSHTHEDGMRHIVLFGEIAISEPTKKHRRIAENQLAPLRKRWELRKVFMINPIQIKGNLKFQFLQI